MTRRAGGPEQLAAVVAHRTEISGGYLAHAAHQSMTVYLDDWEQAHRRLTRRIEMLRQARDERKAATEAGLWP